MAFIKERALSDEQNKANKKKIKGAITDALIPISSLIALLLIAIFVLIPMLDNTLLTMQQTKDLTRRYAQLEDVYNGIYSMNEEDLNSNYANAATVIPNSMQVGDFAKFINNIAIKDGLDLEQIRAEDSQNTQISKLSKISNIRGIHSVEAPLAYVGSYDEIVKFLEDIFVKIPYVISADSLTISTVDKKAGLWKVELRIKAFYLENDDNMKPNLYANFLPYTKFPNVLIELRTRARSNF